MIGNVNTMLIDGAMCVMPWKHHLGEIKDIAPQSRGTGSTGGFCSHGEPP